MFWCEGNIERITRKSHLQPMKINRLFHKLKFAKSVSIIFCDILILVITSYNNSEVFLCQTKNHI